MQTSNLLTANVKFFLDFNQVVRIEKEVNNSNYFMLRFQLPNFPEIKHYNYSLSCTYDTNSKTFFLGDDSLVESRLTKEESDSLFDLIKRWFQEYAIANKN